MLYKAMPWWHRLISIIFGGSILIILWELILVLNIATPLLLPEPARVLNQLLVLLKKQSFWMDIGSTVWTWMFGVIIGFLIGAAGGLLLGLNRYIWAAVEPWIEFLRSLPSVVLVPLISLFLGVGASSRFTCSALVVAVMMISTAGTGLRTVSSSHLRLAGAWKVTRWQEIRVFLIPTALSHMMVALRAAIPIALIVTVAADMLIATESGVGKVIMDALAVFDTPTMYAAIIVVGVLGYLSAILGSLFERMSIHWSGK